MKIISIIIPVYNQENLIIRSLDSIPRRSDLEVIIIEDKSTDNTLEVIENYITDFHLHYKLIKNQNNLGCAASLNIGINNSSGKYILQLDSDDYLMKDDFDKFIDELYSYDEDLIFFDNIVNDGTIFCPIKMNGLCDHICLYKKSIIGETRYKEQRCAAGLEYHRKILSKPHTERYYEKILYRYNYPREGSNYDLYKRGLLKP